MVLGCAVGGAIILLLELSVRGFRGPEELQEATGLQVLAAIPRVAPRNVLGPGLWRFLEEEPNRSEEHPTELQSLMRISYAALCLKKKQHNKPNSANDRSTN